MNLLIKKYRIDVDEDFWAYSSHGLDFFLYLARFFGKFIFFMIDSENVLLQNQWIQNVLNVRYHTNLSTNAYVATSSSYSWIADQPDAHEYLIC